MPFRPSRLGLGTQLLRFLGAADRPSLEFGEVVQPVTDLSDTQSPGMYSTPQRELWMAAGTVTGTVGDFAAFSVWAAPSTFNSADHRIAAGVWILAWEARALGGGAFTGSVVEVGVQRTQTADPGPGLANGTVQINSIGGGFDRALQRNEDVLENRSPRAQVTMQQPAASLALGAVDWPTLNTTRVSSDNFPPMYVGPAFQFVIQHTATNEGLGVGVIYVEAEEPPILPPGSAFF